GMSVTSIEQELLDVRRINGRSVMPQRFKKPREGPTASEYIENPETLTRNLEGRPEALQKRGHAYFSIVRALLRHIVGQAAATLFFILELPRDPIQFCNMPLGVATSL